jgi:hypothetical protein
LEPCIDEYKGNGNVLKNKPMGKISEFGTSGGEYMSFQQHLDNYPDREELKIFLRAQEIGRMSKSDNFDPEKVQKLLTEEFGSTDAAIEKFETVTRNITKNWEPERERKDSSFDGLMQHASTKGGIDLRKIENQEGRYGYNGGRGCDVGPGGGPCSCGAWH